MIDLCVAIVRGWKVTYFAIKSLYLPLLAPPSGKDPMDERASQSFVLGPPSREKLPCSATCDTHKLFDFAFALLKQVDFCLSTLIEPSSPPHWGESPSLPPKRFPRAQPFVEFIFPFPVTLPPKWAYFPLHATVLPIIAGFLSALAVSSPAISRTTRACPSALGYVIAVLFCSLCAFFFLFGVVVSCMLSASQDCPFFSKCYLAGLTAHRRALLVCSFVLREFLCPSPFPPLGHPTPINTFRPASLSFR